MFRPLAALALFLAAAAAPAQDVEFFEQRIRPLLAEHCYSCHGPLKQRSGLRLDSISAILRGGDRGPAVVPASPETSLLIEAVRYAGEDLRMPPKGKLSANQVADLVAWVKRGAIGPRDDIAAKASGDFDLAERRRHWAYQQVRQVQPPHVDGRDWCRTAVDPFILARLEGAGLAPAPPAEARTLIRRLYFDLIGLPPAPAEVAAFVEAAGRDRQAALTELVDHVLASPHYGERWARHWLDLVRYYESMGYEFDFDIYNAWRYRDYVIRACNEDLPYDQFVLEHLAGDLLPRPRWTRDGCNESIVATAFFHFHEGKQTPVDIRQEECDRVDNQIDVLGKAFLAQTIACARCHDHKFDAISTHDYYALAGYLKSSRYQQAFLDHPEQIQFELHRLAELRAQIRDAVIKLWSSDLHNLRNEHPWFVDRAERMQPALAAKAPSASAGAAPAKYAVVEDFRRLDFEGWYPAGAAFGQRPAQGGELLVGLPLRLATRGAHSGLLSRRLQGELRSRSFTLDQGYLHFRVAGQSARVNLVIDGYTLIMRPMYGGLTFTAESNRPAWQTMDVRRWKGHRAFIEISDSSIRPHGLSPPPSDGSVLHGPTDGYIVVEQILASDDSDPPTASSKLDVRRGGLPGLLLTALQHWRDGAADDDEIMLLNSALEHRVLTSVPLPLMLLIAEYRRIEETLPQPQRAPALADGNGEDDFVLLRGNHKTPGDRVLRRPPEVFASTAPVAVDPRSSGRLELARRLVRADNPLLARVLVNRLWQHHFGHGLVRTPDDFGRMGQPPSHPELLDFLATEFVRQGWSLKKLHRLMVLSAAYQQASLPKSHPADPENRLLHHMPLRRLEGEALRDAVLAVSGRLDTTLFGPSVMPYLTQYMEGRGRPKSGPLDGAGRRTIYLNVRRNFLTPLLIAFDYPISFSTFGKRAVTSVPAQALALMNDPFVLAETRRWADSTQDILEPARRVERLYEMAYARPPTDLELRAALAFLDDQARRHGDSVRAWGDLCHVLVNVKEFYVIP